MHVLRAEKGYIIVGQETDGTTTAADVGLGWMLSKKKWYIGLQSVERPALTRADRRELVGLLPVDPALHVPEGSALLMDGRRGTAGNVTSSYRSVALGRTFGLGLLSGGRACIGTQVDALVGTERVPVQVVEPVFWDPQNERRDG
jgi:sarcosine oxidase, subunit alpha